MITAEPTALTTVPRSDVTSVDQISDWLKRHVSDTESYITQDFKKLYGPRATLPIIPKAVTDYFNDAENRTSDPMALEKLAKARELTEATYRDQRRYIDKYIESRSRKLFIEYSVQILKKATTGINQVLSAN